MAHWITLPDMNGEQRQVNADLVFTVFRDGNKTVLSTIGDTVFMTPESVSSVMSLIVSDDR